MTRLLPITFGVLLLASPLELSADTVYTAYGPGSNLGTIDTATGLGSHVGSFGLPGFPTVANAAAFDFDDQGTLYTIVTTLGTPEVANSRLGIIHPSGEIETVGSPFDLNMLAMEIDQTGRLLGVGSTSGVIPTLPPHLQHLQTYGDTTLYEIDKETGQHKSLVDLQIPHMMDLAIDSVGTIYGTTDNVLYEIDPSDGATSHVDITGIGGGAIMGIMFGEDENLYATAFTPDSPLFTIDLTSGVATPLGGTATPTGLVRPHGGDIPTHQTPAGVIKGMLDAVDHMDLNPGIANALSTKLGKTYEIVRSEVEHPDAAHRMESFLHFVGNHDGTQISAEDAGYLMHNSQTVISLFGAGTSGVTSVPEPSCLILTCLAVLGTVAGLRRRTI